MKKVIVTMGAIAAIIAWLVTGCAKTNEADLRNSSSDSTINTCDTANSTYTAAVLPILKTNCYSCHGNGQSMGGISLDGYTAVKAQASNGNLIGVITHAGGYPPMPQGGDKLSDCDINKIRSWIANGIQNN